MGLAAAQERGEATSARQVPPILEIFALKISLKNDLCSDLNKPGIAIYELDSPETTATDISIWIRKMWSVQGIEQF
jgi:hypothetical protein